jgi:hypothetical protein
MLRVYTITQYMYCLLHYTVGVAPVPVNIMLRVHTITQYMYCLLHYTVGVAPVPVIIMLRIHTITQYMYCLLQYTAYVGPTPIHIIISHSSHVSCDDPAFAQTQNFVTLLLRGAVSSHSVLWQVYELEDREIGFLNPRKVEICLILNLPLSTLGNPRITSKRHREFFIRREATGS